MLVSPPLFSVTEGSQALWVAKPLHSEDFCLSSSLLGCLPSAALYTACTSTWTQRLLFRDTDDCSGPQAVLGSLVVGLKHPDLCLLPALPAHGMQPVPGPHVPAAVVSGSALQRGRCYLPPTMPLILLCATAARQGFCSVPAALRLALSAFICIKRCRTSAFLVTGYHCHRKGLFSGFGGVPLEQC